MGTQEVMTRELAEKIQRYESELRHWQSKQTISRRGGFYALALAIPLWVVSYASSSMTGAVNQDKWFAALALFSFCGALGLTIAAAVLGGFILMDEKPIKDFNTEKTVRSDNG